MKTHRLIVVFALAWILGVSATVVNAQESAAISFTPIMSNSNQTSEINVGDEITFDLIVSVNNINPGIHSVGIDMKYDPEVVELITPAAVEQPQDDFFDMLGAGAGGVDQCPDGSQACFSMGMWGPAQVTKRGSIMRFYFVGKTRGTACFSIVKSTLWDANGSLVSHSMPKEQCISVGSQPEVVGTVLRQGVLSIPSPGMGTLACSSVSATNGTKEFSPITTDTNGKFNFSGLPNGTYIFHVSYPGYLPSEVSGVIVNDTYVDLETTNLRGGDVNGDNVVNILDIGTIVSKFGRTGVAVRSALAGCTGADEPADINDDGQINIGDLAIAAGNWMKTGPTLWQ